MSLDFFAHETCCIFWRFAVPDGSYLGVRVGSERCIWSPLIAISRDICSLWPVCASNDLNSLLISPRDVQRLSWLAPRGGPWCESMCGIFQMAFLRYIIPHVLPVPLAFIIARIKDKLAGLSGVLRQ